MTLNQARNESVLNLQKKKKKKNNHNNKESTGAGALLRPTISLDSISIVVCKLFVS